jgi:hypothetical protein
MEVSKFEVRCEETQICLFPVEDTNGQKPAGQVPALCLTDDVYKLALKQLFPNVQPRVLIFHLLIEQPALVCITAFSVADERQ